MKRIFGITLIAISAVSFGTLAIFGRYAYADGMDIFTLLFMRFGTAAVFMIVILLIRREALPGGRVLAQLIGMGALGYVGQSYLYMSAIKYASAGLVALLLYLYPIFVFILSVTVLNEKASSVQVLALVMALGGSALTMNPNGGQLIGVLMAIAAALIYSVYIIVGTSVMNHVSAVQSSAVIFASAGVVFAVLALTRGTHFPDGYSGWLALSGIIVISTIIPVVTFLAGLEIIGPTNAAMLSTLEPLVTVLLAAWLFAERLKPAVMVGGGLILIAVILLTRTELQERATDP